MEMKIDIVSTELVTPSSSTPSELRDLKLSLLDQTAPSSYIPLLFFYPAGAGDHLHISDHGDRCRRLKKSLAETLTRYYPVAGALIEGYLVDCNDAGVQFSEARVSCRLPEVMADPDVLVLQRLLPFDPSENSERDCILAVRYNVFACNGVVVALFITHKIADGISAAAFAKNWAAACRGAPEIETPTFGASKLFPPLEVDGIKRRARMNRVVTRRFIFNASSLSTLKSQASSGGVPGDRPPSRVEAVSAFLWKRFMALARSREIRAKRFAALHAVNLRRRISPALPENSFGNLWWFALAEAPIEEEKEYAFLVSEIRKAIRGIDGEYVKTSVQDAERCMKMKMELGRLVYSGELEMCTFSSWCGFPVYDVDFGWGKPAWFCSPGRPFKKVVHLFYTCDGKGIEAWVNLEENDMKSFECDPEVLALTTSSGN